MSAAFAKKNSASPSGLVRALHPQLWLVHPELALLARLDEPALKPVAWVARVEGEHRLVWHPRLPQPRHEAEYDLLIYLLRLVEEHKADLRRVPAHRVVEADEVDA